jgi:hypothetical protein
MPRLSLTSLVAAFSGSLLLCGPALPFTAPLSDTAVRQAYFLGQRRDEATTHFLDLYTKYPPPPRTGPYISAIQFFTPYAQLVERSRQYSVGYSAQRAEQDYRGRSDTIAVAVYIECTPTYSAVIVHPAKRSGEPTAYSLRSPDFWQDFQVQASQRGSVIEPINRSGAPRYLDDVLVGATIWLTFDAQDLTSDDAAVEIDAPDGQHVAATFDLAKLR